jgi:hypothetical protein
MKENVIHHKGDNPLVGLPALSFILAHLLLVLTIWANAWDKLNGWDYFFHIVLSLWISFAFYAIPFNSLNSNLYNPCIVYASKRLVRLSVTAASLLGCLLLLSLLASQKNPSIQSVASATCYACSFIGTSLLATQIIIALFFKIPAKTKPERRKQPKCAYLSPFAGVASCTLLGLHHENLITSNIGESSFMMTTVSSIALLWFEDKDSGIADRETVPLCTASILWIVSALIANYAYTSLASVTFVLPYLVYFLPLIFLGFYYYISAPEEN